jgi:hypothetical protein
MERGFAYFRGKRPRYIPKTAAAALRGVDAQILPKEAFLFKAASVEPLDSEPYNLVEIGLVLDRTGLDIQTNLLLMKVLRKLINSREPEVAQFAAEGINVIENRYSSQVERLKHRLEEEKEKEAPLSELARTYYELSLLHGKSGAMKNFYLKEAYSYLGRIDLGKVSDTSIISMAVKILLELRLFRQAVEVLEKSWRQHDPSYLLLMAEIAFRQRHFESIPPICERLADLPEDLGENDKAVVAYWSGR